MTNDLEGVDPLLLVASHHFPLQDPQIKRALLLLSKLSFSPCPYYSECRFLREGSPRACQGSAMTLATSQASFLLDRRSWENSPEMGRLSRERVTLGFLQRLQAVDTSCGANAACAFAEPRPLPFSLLSLGRLCTGVLAGCLGSTVGAHRKVCGAWRGVKGWPSCSHVRAPPASSAFAPSVSGPLALFPQEAGATERGRERTSELVWVTVKSPRDPRVFSIFGHIDQVQLLKGMDPSSSPAIHRGPHTRCVTLWVVRPRVHLAV